MVGMGVRLAEVGLELGVEGRGAEKIVTEDPG